MPSTKPHEVNGVDLFKYMLNVDAPRTEWARLRSMNADRRPNPDGETERRVPSDSQRALLHHEQTERTCSPSSDRRSRRGREEGQV